MSATARSRPTARRPGTWPLACAPSPPRSPRAGPPLVASRTGSTSPATARTSPPTTAGVRTRWSSSPAKTTTARRPRTRRCRRRRASAPPGIRSTRRSAPDPRPREPPTPPTPRPARRPTVTQVTANPVAMQEFVTGMGTAKDTLADAQTTEAATVRAFLNEGSTGITGGYEIVGPAMNALIHELVEVKDWVKVVRDAAIEADVGAHGDHTISADALNVALNRIAGERGIDLQALAASSIVTPPVTGITPVPQDSGFVNDPVCTATGHLLVDATDFAMPARLAVLSFRRLYASQDMAEGAFGPGWWSWTEARGGINARGGFDLVGPDARHATFAPDGDGGFLTPPHLDLEVTVEGDAQRLRWGRRSPHFGQTWIFRHGLPRQ